MGKCLLITAVIAAIVVGVVYQKITTILFAIPAVPKLEDTWWGPRDPSSEDTEIKPFKINVPDEVLKDLQQRLSNAMPFQQPLEGAKQHYGINTNLLSTIVEFWRTKYDWRAREKFLNQYPQYTVSVQGYGFSEAAVRPGLGAVQVALVFKNFMKRLDYDRYYLQGGDWGGVIVQHMAALFPEHIIGMHSNICAVLSPLAQLKTFIGSFYPPLVVSKEHEHKMYPLSEKYAYLILETGYMHLQATKPDTAGVALRESPVGLAAYIIEKFTTWTNPAWKDLDDGGLTKKYTLTKLLDNVMIYWVTRSITTSMRLYSETFNKAQFGMLIEKLPIEVPSGCAKFSNELMYQPDSILKEVFINLIHSADYEGGHFAAFEVPEVLGEDIYEFVNKVEILKTPESN